MRTQRPSTRRSSIDRRGFERASRRWHLLAARRHARVHRDAVLEPAVLVAVVREAPPRVRVDGDRARSRCSCTGSTSGERIRVGGRRGGAAPRVPLLHPALARVDPLRAATPSRRPSRPRRWRWCSSSCRPPSTARVGCGGSCSPGRSRRSARRSARSTSGAPTTRSSTGSARTGADRTPTRTGSRWRSSRCCRSRSTARSPRAGAGCASLFAATLAAQIARHRAHPLALGLRRGRGDRARPVPLPRRRRSRPAGSSPRPGRSRSASSRSRRRASGSARRRIVEYETDVSVAGRENAWKVLGVIVEERPLHRGRRRRVHPGVGPLRAARGGRAPLHRAQRPARDRRRARLRRLRALLRVHARGCCRSSGARDPIRSSGRRRARSSRRSRATS